jgi:hypothetical protein
LAGFLLFQAKMPEGKTLGKLLGMNGPVMVFVLSGG